MMTKFYDAMRLRAGAVATLFLIASVFSAKGSIGDTAESLRAADGKYGAPSGETSPVLKDSQERADLFKENRITVEYGSDGKVWRVIYRRRNMSDERIEFLLGLNSTGGKWSKEIKFRGNLHWISADGNLHAVYYAAPLYKLVVMTDKAAKSERNPQSMKVRETKDLSSEKADPAKAGEEEAEPEKEKNLLDDF